MKKEVPLSTRETRNNLKEWLGQWQSNFENSQYHVNVEATFFNSPEGCLSIFMELMNAGSLQVSSSFSLETEFIESTGVCGIFTRGYYETNWEAAPFGFR